ncbi:MAG: Glycosyl transferases group 1 [Pelotomaculum sp. PtaB.Bin013]|nr:MAG: Glycosyl transferases group 1 [Pelotomaculum sp. PtaB.Bin013]
MKDIKHNPEKICFIALGAYPLLAEKDPKNVIGPDVHQVILAKELMKRDFKIVVITYNKGGKPVELIDGIEIINIGEDAHDLKMLNIVLKFFYIWCAMRKADAPIYFRHGGGGGVVSLFCRINKKKFIYHIGSDGLVNRDLITHKNREFSRSKFSLSFLTNWLDIKLADAVIVQTEYQDKMLKKNFGRDGVLIKKPFPLTEREMPKKTKLPIVLWVGSMADVKQPELFIKLAEAIPDAQFQMIGGNSGNHDLCSRIKESSKKISNFQHLGVVPFNEINDYFRQASILVNTSIFEAYPPYAAMQAWMNYTPVVSLGDNSDEIICRYNMGFHSKTFEQMVRDIKTLLQDEALREEMGANGRDYIEREHNFITIIGEYIELFDRIGKIFIDLH